MDNVYLNEIKKLLQINIDDEILVRILFDLNKYFDKKLTGIFRIEQEKNEIIFDSITRKLLRNYYYYEIEENLNNINIQSFPSIIFSNNEIIDVCQKTIERLNKYDPKKILKSIIQRYKNLVLYKKSSISYRKEWLKYYEDKRNRLFDYSLLVIRITNEDYKKNHYSPEYIYKIIRDTYKKLENYRHMILVFDGPILNNVNIDITWQVIYKTLIYSENFVQYKDDFFPFKRNKQIKLLKDYIQKEFSNVDGEKIASTFYSTISYGYRYEDCYIDEEQSKIILTLKKVNLDESPVPCPSCMTTIQSGNSYPELFLRSYECKNPNCQDRSKSGRGKRFDEYSTYRFFKLEEHNSEDVIPNELYRKWRRDIFPSNADWLKMAVKYYSWRGEKLLFYNVPLCNGKIYNRQIINYTEYNFEANNSENNNSMKTSYEGLPIVKLFNEIVLLINRKNSNQTFKKDLEIIKGDSSEELRKYKKGQIGTTITSPPYYNAREYSQWSNLILYLIDMMKNAAAVYDSMVEGGKYLYNIGDIVSSDNVYVASNMSKRRLPLGFLSSMIFELVGFNLIENIIWDKGEVHSKRNSTINLIAGYVKCVNCYEHVLVFGKKSVGKNNRKVVSISPVIKINSKGENTYKHTAPYPLKLVELIKPYIVKDKYILDPFLGSGTTLKWCKDNGYHGVGFEINDDYYELAKEKIYEKHI